MRALTWMAVAVMALMVVGCAQQKQEELPQIDPAMIEAPPPAEAKPAIVEVETPLPAVPAVTKDQTPAAMAGGQSYTVQKGDTLYSLAKRFYGDGKLWTRIADANKGKVRDVSTISVDTVLVIPPK
ncbi:MAG: LysM peptidoglycan-binding domain-containing protein [Planctomycetes bacterium]|nr:LysM peptidoglycan-binding domain-containing protein [Planctomycetota bacterium]